jgi:hypothetical protein
MCVSFFSSVIIKLKMAGTEMFKMRNFGFDLKGGGVVCAHTHVCVCVNILKFVMCLP